MAIFKAVSPWSPITSDEAPQERRDETVLSDADKAALISSVLPSLVFCYKKTGMRMIMIYIAIGSATNLTDLT